jgi:homoserine kinase
VNLPLRARAPATSANLGPGFDCAGVALELWNEVVVREGGEPDRGQLGVRAFALLADPSGLEFDFTVRIPRERGLGSSASVIALGLVAAAAAAGEDSEPERLLTLGVPLEGHADNLAAALAGGVCLTWEGRIARVADALPFVPIAVVPDTRVLTAAARASLPGDVTHQAAAATVAHALLLGAAFASQEPDLFAAALHDELHEPYRAAHAPALHEIRTSLPAGAVGATLSGSGPTVIVWAREADADACAAELRARYPRADVLPLRVAAEGASAAPLPASPPGAP